MALTNVLSHIRYKREGGSGGALSTLATGKQPMFDASSVLAGFEASLGGGEAGKREGSATSDDKDQQPQCVAAVFGCLSFSSGFTTPWCT